MGIECFNTSCIEYGDYPNCVDECILQQSRSARINWATPVIAGDQILLLPKSEKAVLLLEPETNPRLVNNNSIKYINPNELLGSLMSWAFPDVPTSLALIDEKMYVEADPYKNPLTEASGRVMERVWWSLDGHFLPLVGEGMHLDSWKSQLQQREGCYNCNRSIPQHLGWNTAKQLTWGENIHLAHENYLVSLKNWQEIQHQRANDVIEKPQTTKQIERERLHLQTPAVQQKMVQLARIDANGNVSYVSVQATKGPDNHWYRGNGEIVEY